ncbi:MAG: hypothetical protein V4582_00075 [Pseudomonadota bacterium]
MSQLSALAPRAGQTSYLPPPAEAGTQGARAGAPPSVNGSGRHQVIEPVSLSNAGINLARGGLAARANELGNSTIDLAQQFINSFASQLFGDAAKGATISFDSASIDTASSFAASVEHASGPNGSSDSAAFRLNESADFIGKGQITTADGRRFEFEIEVKYESTIEGAATRSSSNASAPPAPAASGASGVPASQDDAAAPATQALPDIAFPGSLADLFKLLGRQLQAQVQDAPDAPPAAQHGGRGGNLALRLLKLIEKPEPVAAAPADDQAKAAARSKLLAKAYDSATEPVQPAPAKTEP